MKKISQMLGEIYTGHNQSLCEHVKNRPKSTNFLPLAHMELHLVKLSYAPNLYYPSPSHKMQASLLILFFHNLVHNTSSHLFLPQLTSWNSV